MAFRFGILLGVRSSPTPSQILVVGVLGAALCGVAVAWSLPQQPGAPGNPAAKIVQSTATSSPTSTQPAPLPSQQSPAASALLAAHSGLNIVVLDPAHGGTDPGARGTEGITESDEVLQFATATKKALEARGFQVILTREGNDNPSFDDRSARANAQRGAVFITLHIASTGLTGTARVYVEPEVPASNNITGLIPWDRAQAPFLSLSRKLGDLVQQELSKRFKGSPDTLQTAPVRQLRTTAAPAIAVEISSVSVKERAELDRMVPGVAEAIARGLTDFRPTYVVPTIPVPGGSVQP
ncbi:MAG TPA: N-acetylmuramoyl-L-alanine amidase [Candidatus Udaeobacter sp.]|nr:N-acetylmuramoyl-L-alanine amidase [Candidatus Udaeobacter sp.]